MTININYDDFQKNEGALFLLKEHDLHIRLVEVSPQKISGPWETFSLLFKAEGEFSLEQGTFFLESDVLGELDIFLVPIGESAEDTSVSLYESVFSRQANGQA